MIDQHICIVGLGLMGGSLAQALAGQTRGLNGVDAHAATRQQALADGIFDLVTDDLAQGLRDADFAVLATPVHTILDIIEALPQSKPGGCLVLDFGSTKQAIGEALSALPDCFAALGGHPMCGKETAGYQAADGDLFRGQTFVLCHTARSNTVVEEHTLALLAQIGAQPLFMEAQSHDQIVAAVSHLPYVLSAVLARQVTAGADERLWQISASGFRDTSRLAGSDPRMMLDILMTNRLAVLDQLQEYKLNLEQIRHMLLEEDAGALAAWLAGAQQEHAAYRQAKDSSSRKPD